MDDMMANWRHKDQWSQSGKDFLVTVTRHYGTEDFKCGPHRWCVYAYLYPRHPHFAKFDGTERLWQDAAGAMPLYGGATLVRYHYDADHKVMSVQVGADYNHLHDEAYTHCANAAEAYSVFRDAGDLYAYLQALATAPSEADAA